MGNAKKDAKKLHWKKRNLNSPIILTICSLPEGIQLIYLFDEHFNANDMKIPIILQKY